jgi:serine/threonine protein kinase
VGATLLEPQDLTIGRSIAAGAFAEVFRGLLWGQKVAVKRLFLEREGADEASLRRELEHETRLLHSVSHPCILTLIGYTHTPAQIVLEVLDGTVYDLVRAGPDQIDGGMLSPLLDILSACAYLHARSPPILHRDLKPPNVLHDARNRCKLCDFGTAMELPPSAPRPTEWMGSALYVAPEVDREDPYGLAADVFSFGTPPPQLSPSPPTPNPTLTLTPNPHPEPSPRTLLCSCAHR